MQRLIVVTSLVALLSACSVDPAKTTSDTSSAPNNPPPVASATVASAAPQETEAQRLQRLTQSLTKNSVYFAYDDYSIKPEYGAIIKQDYDILMSTPTLSITLTGNADERGSSEYNLALGQKRAESVKRALKFLGLPESRMEAISYGKEKPQAVCHEEKCWADNRRVDVAGGKP